MSPVILALTVLTTSRALVIVWKGAPADPSLVSLPEGDT
jgi:hypothetical protein